jgi:hypothetical protein
MILTTRNLLLSLFVLLLGYASWRMYVHFFYTTPPTVEVQGIVSENYYRGNISCVATVSSHARVHALTITLDELSVLPKDTLCTSTAQPFIIASQAMNNGCHVLTVEAIDATKHRNKSTVVIPFYVDNLPLQTAFARSEAEFKVPQGKTFHCVIAANKPLKNVLVKLFSREFVAIRESAHTLLYECFVPIECESKAGEYPFQVLINDFVGNHAELAAQLQVIPATFKRQILHNIDTSKFEEERKLGRSHKELYDELARVAEQSPKNKLWQGTFYVPINSTWVACEFGAKRISQERGCYTHAAIDMVGPMPHTVVWAPQDGIIAIKDRFEITGNTIVIDHGCGVITLLCHLDQFADLAVGDKIRRGSPVGFTGKTGYATGDHLHWEMRVNNVQVDPMQWTKADF